MKQVILVNEALNLPRGKLAAQVADASLSAYLRAPQPARERWMADGMPTVVLHCEVEAELIKFESRAADLNLPTALITDAGHTVVAPGTVTCLAIGPAAAYAIDGLTGSLKLVR